MPEPTAATRLFHDKLPVIAIQPQIQESDSDQHYQYGLIWEEQLFSLKPTWTVEPDIDVVRQICKCFIESHLANDQTTCIRVEKLAEGAFNKVYILNAKIQTVSTPKQQVENGYTGHNEDYLYVFRASLPVNRRFKTLSEYATLTYLRKHTTIPVARVLAVNPATSENINPLRFEWMIQTFIPGGSLEGMWTRLDETKRQHVVRQLVQFHVELFHLQHETIGSLYMTNTIESDQAFKLGEIATVPFFYDDRVNMKNMSRGPFKSSRDWLKAQLSILQVEHLGLIEKMKAEIQTKATMRRSQRSSLMVDALDVLSEQIPESSNDTSIVTGGEGPYDSERKAYYEDNDDDDEDILDEYEAILGLVQKLLSCLPKVFPDVNGGTNGSSVLRHQDLRQSNILVDEQGNVTAILDWENTAFLPVWAACDIPKFLMAKPRHSLPDPKDFMGGEEETMYKERLLEYEMTELRETFISEMTITCPQWVEVHEKSQALRDFARAVDSCDYCLARGRIWDWLDLLEANDYQTVGDNYTPLCLWN